MQALGAVTGMDLTAGDGLARAARLAPQRRPQQRAALRRGLRHDRPGADKTTPDLEKQLKQLQQTSQILGATTVDGAKALRSARRSAA